MARQRMVKPDLRTSLTCADWPRDVRYLWVLLWGYLDDEGRGEDQPRRIKADCLPYDDDVTGKDVDQWLHTMATLCPEGDTPALCRYEVDGIAYLHAVKWHGNQKPQHPAPSKLPPCPLEHRPRGREESRLTEPQAQSESSPSTAGSGEASPVPHEDSGVLMNPREDSEKGSVVLSPELSWVELSWGEEVLAPADGEREQEPDPPPPPRRSKSSTRRRDELCDAVLEVCGIPAAELTASARGPLNRALKELREVGATPELVHQRAAVYRQRFKGAALTPLALSKHWGACATPVGRAGGGIVSMGLAYADQLEAEEAEEAEQARYLRALPAGGVA